MGLIYGVYGGRSDGFQPGRTSVCLPALDYFTLLHIRTGGASFETGFCPHGGQYGTIRFLHTSADDVILSIL